VVRGAGRGVANGPCNLARGGRLRAASRSDQPRSQDGRHRNSLLELHGGQAKAEAVSAFQRGARGNIRDTGLL
jgi:hypothetical protein